MLNGYLLDTNILLLATFRSSELSGAARSAIETGTVFASAISYWKVIIKQRKGRLDVGDPAAWWRDTLEQLGAIPLAFTAEHVTEVEGLALLHSDPFDRALIAQAIAEELALVTRDAEILRYASPRLQVIS